MKVNSIEVLPGLISRLLAIVAILLLPGCATVPSSVDSAALAAIKRVAVVSVAGRDLVQQHVGTTMFNNTVRTHNVSYWGLDEHWEELMFDSVAAAGSFEPVRANVDQTTLDALAAVNNPSAGFMLSTQAWTAAQESLQALASQSGANAILLLVRAAVGDYLGNTNQVLKGLGIYTRGFFGSTQTASLHLVADLYLIDGGTGRPLAGVMLFDGDRPLASVPATLRETALSDLSEEEKDKVRKQALDLPAAAMGPTVAKLLKPRELAAGAQ